jgi:superfamily I DNA/RNA helicase
VQLLDGLNVEQRLAVEGDGPVLIVAGPGTGKTKTLVARIVYLLEDRQVPPKQILALTFTKKAAKEMSARVEDLLSLQEGSCQAVRPFPVLVPARGAGAAPRPATPLISTFHALCHELLGGDIKFIAEPERLKLIKSLPRPNALRHLSVREVGLLISKAKNSVRQEDDTVAKFTHAYNVALAEQDLHDFDDLLLKTHQLLQNDESARQAAQARFKFILVDEFQDTNRLQYEVLQLLNNHDNIFVIGDPKQSIYGFRGASGDIFESFKKDFPNRQEITLHVNYRSKPNVVDLANAVFAERAPLIAHAAGTGRVQTILTLNEYAEASWVLDEIQRAIGGGDFLHAVSDDERTQHRRLSDFAVLYRSRSAAIALQKAFAESGLPYQIVGDGSPYDQPRVQDVLALLKACVEGTEVAIKGFTKMQCRTLLTDVSPTQPPAKIVAAIAKRFGLEATSDLTQLSNLLVRFDSLPPALTYLESIAEGQFYDPQADAVTLLTIHAAKGLEFEHVFLVACEEGILPHEKADQEEERRLFYVGVTRARQNLDILYTKFRAGKPAQPSRFIGELEEAVLPKTVDSKLGNDERRAKKRRAKRSQQSLF